MNSGAEKRTESDEMRTRVQEMLNVAHRARVPGVGPDASTVTNENGASQSEVGFHMTSLPVRALLAVARVQKHGDDKYGKNNWRGISVDDHLNHALIHYAAHQLGDEQDLHLEHLACRVLMALETYLTEKGL